MNFFKRSVTVITALGGLSLLAPPALAGFNVIDFDKTDAGSNIVDGQIINDEYLANFGVTISGCNWNGKAYVLDSTEPGIKYHLAYVLYKLGRIDEAKKQLERLFEDHDDFQQQAKAKALLAALKV